MLTLILVNLLALASAQHPVCAARQQTYLDAGCCGEDQATVCVSPTLPGLNVTRPNFLTMEDINAYNPLNADEAACGAYSKPFMELDGQQLHLVLLVTKLNCIGSFSTSPDPYDETAYLYTFPPLYVVNYASHTQSSGPRTDTCTFYAKTPFAYAPPLLQSAIGLTEETTPVSNGFFEQGSCLEYNATSNKFMKFQPYYMYNFSHPDALPSESFLSDFNMMPLGTANWYMEAGAVLDRWDV